VKRRAQQCKEENRVAQRGEFTNAKNTQSERNNVKRITTRKDSSMKKRGKQCKKKKRKKKKIGLKLNLNPILC
jgi:hypothetical protein